MRDEVYRWIHGTIERLAHEGDLALDDDRVWVSLGCEDVDSGTPGKTRFAVFCSPPPHEHLGQLPTGNGQMSALIEVLYDLVHLSEKRDLQAAYDFAETASGAEVCIDVLRIHFQIVGTASQWVTIYRGDQESGWLPSDFLDAPR